RANSSSSRAGGSRRGAVVSTPRSGARGAARTSPAAPERTSGAFGAVGRGLRGGWGAMAKGLGHGVRGLGGGDHDKVSPPHRRDGLGLVLLGVAIVVAGAVWFGAAGPVGEWIDTGLRTVMGTPGAILPLLLAGWGILLMAREPRPDVHSRWLGGATVTRLGVLVLWRLAAGATARAAGMGAPGAILPLLLAGWGILLMAREPRPDVHSRWLVGATVTGLGVLGLWHLAAGAPADPDGVRSGAGVLGRIVGGTVES